MSYVLTALYIVVVIMLPVITVILVDHSTKLRNGVLQIRQLHNSLKEYKHALEYGASPYQCYWRDRALKAEAELAKLKLL